MKLPSRFRLRKGVAAMIGAVVLIAFGCSWPGPHLQQNWAVETQFDNYQLYPDYHYYVSGDLKDPRAVLALKPGYTLDSSGWQPVNMTVNDLEQWIQALKMDSLVEYNTFPNGANIIGSKGEIAGVYYSVWELPLVQMQDENTFLLVKPRAEYRSTSHWWEFSVDDNDRTN